MFGDTPQESSTTPPQQQHQQPPNPPSSFTAMFQDTLRALESPQSPRTTTTTPRIDPPWTPTYLFVYGSLMDPDVLQHVLALPSPPPPLRPARLKNYKMKMWGIYPTLIPNPDDGHSSTSIDGRLYLVEHPAHFTLLEMYESRAYTWDEVVVEFADGDGGTTEQAGFKCRTFVWAGSAGSRELEEGGFDFERYRRVFKPAFLRGDID
ncbi:hypothetical protein FQN52_005062 [Onygenales sp. PD_12]|nr:hypothetical protein FQN52_005062 [Onygenales sp. PD_12]